jgi:hypothetical protein
MVLTETKRWRQEYTA